MPEEYKIEVSREVAEEIYVNLRGRTTTYPIYVKTDDTITTIGSDFAMNRHPIHWPKNSKFFTTEEYINQK
jgi:uncharacterized protein (DUF1684 family)